MSDRDLVQARVRELARRDWDLGGGSTGRSLSPARPSSWTGSSAGPKSTNTSPTVEPAGPLFP
jgi:hypothetical protein